MVFVPKYRKQAIFGQLRRQIGGMIRDLCTQHDMELIEGHATLPTTWKTQGPTGQVVASGFVQLRFNAGRSDAHCVRLHYVSAKTLSRFRQTLPASAKTGSRTLSHPTTPELKASK